MSHQFNFVLKKLVLVDSAGFCYSEIELDKHTILLGEGNVGKSSLLNCIRLFLLPEVNFKKAKDKFNFRSSNGDEYGQEQSYEHYFPTKYSHLIIEVEKIIGGKKYTHCQILYRTKNLCFERIFTTLSYSEVRILFWAVRDDDEHMIGGRVDKLSTQDVFARIKEKDKHCITVKDPQKLKDLMYAKDILSTVAMRYSLFPLNDATEENIESLRALILMLFDMKTSNKAVAKAVANIIESQKKETTDALNFDIQSFMYAHDQLKLEEQKLIDIENKQSEFTQLTRDYANYSKLSSAENDFINFYLYLSKAMEQVNKQLSQLALSVSKYQQDLRPLTKSLTEHNQYVFTAKQNVNKLTKDIDNTTKLIEKAEAEINLYGNMPLSEIIEILEDEVNDTSEKIKALEDTDARRTRIIKLQTQLTEHQQMLAQLELEVSNAQFSLQKQLPTHSLTLLNSLSQKLILANPGRELTEKENFALENFQNLFDDKGYSYSFFGVAISKSNAFASRNYQREIDNVQSEIRAKSSEKKSLENQGSENPLITEKKLKDLSKQLVETNRLRGIIAHFDENKQAVKIYQKQCAENQQTIDNTAPIMTKVLAQQSEITELLETEKLKQKGLEAEQSKLLDLSNSAKATKLAYPKIQRQLETQQDYNSVPAEVSSPYLSNLQLNLQAVEGLRVKIIDSLRNFSRDKFVYFDPKLFEDSPLPSAIKSTYDELKIVYDELQNQGGILRSKTKMHNESVSNYVDILNKNFEHINRFESQLNRSFEGISINDLSSIQVSIQIDKRFSNLISEIHNSFNADSDQTLSEQFYVRLQAFSDAFFKSGERNKLMMSDVINEVSYKVKKDGYDSWQTKQQSTSTTALINLKLVRMLLAKLRADSCMVQLPVIMDEAANINVDQYEWLLDDIRESGFFLFTAGTHSSGAELVHMIGHHYDVDALKTGMPYTKERTRVVWGGPQAFLNESEFCQYSSEQSGEQQLGLLEGADETI
ncbi:MAG: hypothetical protein HRT38_10005 [Alteromonadaceae bacterium]|nr:hypothetical protein [Alteromonadaceae bacterium]